MIDGLFTRLRAGAPFWEGTGANEEAAGAGPVAVVADRVTAQRVRLQWAAPYAGILLVIGIAQWLKIRNRSTVAMDERSPPAP